MKRTDWNVAHSAQGFMKMSEEKPASCGSACGSGDKPTEEKPAACGSACGTGDKSEKEEKPAACGTACGAGEK